MKKLYNSVILLISVMVLLSCTGGGASYEIKSPCVSISDDDSHPYGIFPCPRKPLNFDKIYT